MSLALEWKENPYRPGGSVSHGRDKRAREEAQRARLNRERSRRHRLVFLCFVAVALAVSGLLILSVFLQVAVAQNELKTREVERRVELEMRHQEEMRVQIAALESPGRIESIAAGKLMMVQVANLEYLETPAYQAAKAQAQADAASQEANLSDAAEVGGEESGTAGP